ncbi:MAG: ACP S-malonyltransferase [Treponema sp.]|jgi:[acyl-carrier-protein] S-malonyltransferase|nr:ACP S-malonyltransferase [Treponema sp.]
MVNKKTVFLFPGQGAQYPGMALDLLETGSAAVKELFACASDIMGKDMTALLRDSDAEALKRGDTAQPAITLANLAAAAVLKERGILPTACAGHSLGEYAALHTAGIISMEDCLTLVKLRGAAMQEAADALAAAGGESPGMAAVIGLAPEQVETLVAEWKADAVAAGGALADLYTANFNSPRQTVVSGTAEALALAEERFKTAGARRVIRLQVAGPFHSPLIAGAAEKFLPVLDGVNFKDPTLPFYSNVTGKRVSSGAEAKKLALAQITRAVRWTDEEKAIQDAGIDCALEAGPGKVLQGLWKDSLDAEAGDTDSAPPCYLAGTTTDIAALAI